MDREDEAERQRRRQRRSRSKSPARELPGPPPKDRLGTAVKIEPKPELAANGAAAPAEPLEAADGLDEQERARLKAEKKAAKKEKKVRRQRRPCFASASERQRQTPQAPRCLGCHVYRRGLSDCGMHGHELICCVSSWY